MVRIKRSLSKLYMLPLLGIIKPSNMEAIVNTYLYDKKIKLLKKEKLYIIVKTEYPEVIESFRDSELYIQEYKPLPIEEFEDDYICFIMEIPLEYIKDFNYFLEGKYTEFSLNAKNQIIEFYRSVNYELAEKLEQKLYGYENNRKGMEDYFNLVQFCDELNKESTCYKVRPTRIKITGEIESKPVIEGKVQPIEIVSLDLYFYFWRINHIKKEVVTEFLKKYDLEFENIEYIV